MGKDGEKFCRLFDSNRFRLRKEMQHAIQSDVIERVGRLLRDDGFGAVGNAHAGSGHHRQIVRAVTDDDGLRGFDAQGGADFL